MLLSDRYLRTFRRERATVKGGTDGEVESSKMRVMETKHDSIRLFLQKKAREVCWRK